MNSPLLSKLQRISQLVLRAEGWGKLRADIIFVGPAEIRRLNKRYRGKDTVTDVLSFRQYEPKLPHGDKHFLGEIILCRSRVREQAKDYDVPYSEELARMTIHGTLHLLEYDHIKPRDARVMLPLQEKYLNTLRVRTLV